MPPPRRRPSGVCLACESALASANAKISLLPLAGQSADELLLLSPFRPAELVLILPYQRDSRGVFADDGARPRGLAPRRTSLILSRERQADDFLPPSAVIFGLIILFGAVEVALSTWLVNWYDNRSYPSASYRDRIRFTCFVSWWTLVFAIAYLVFYQIAATSIISSVASHAGWLILTWIFWTAAAASVTAMLGGGLDCGRDYVNCSQLNALEGASVAIS